MTLDPQTIVAITDELAAAERDRTTVPLLSTRYPDMTVEDAYAVQDEWRERGTAAGRRLVGRKIGLTSRVMQEASGITEPDYGAIFADAVVENGSVVDFDRFSNVRVEVELAFRLSAPLQGPGVTLLDVLGATEYVVPALEILSTRIELEGRTIVDTISDNAASAGSCTAVTRCASGGTCGGSPRCCTATRSSRSPAWPPRSSTTRRQGSRGWRTSSPSTTIGSRPASSSSHVAGSGIDWVIIDQEHGPNGLGTTLLQLQTVAAYTEALAARFSADDGRQRPSC